MVVGEATRENSQDWIVIGLETLRRGVVLVLHERWTTVTLEFATRDNFGNLGDGEARMEL
jgi:hypothetical protein